MLRYLFAKILIICSLSVAGQEPVPNLEEPNVIVLSDTIDLATVLPVWDVESYSRHSPAKAAMMSAVLPGLGSVYNKKYWQVPIVYLAIGISLERFITFQNQYNRLRRAHIDLNAGDPNNNFYLTLFPPNTSRDVMGQYINRNKDIMRTWRDWSVVAMVAAYALNIIWANVDAHLIDFDVDDNISLNIRPNILENAFDSPKFGLSLRLSF